VIGQKTFGKGSVQTVYPVDGSSGLRLTTALYYTPAGRSIQAVGIEPDIAVAARADVAGEDADLMRRHVRERDLEGHFRHEQADPEAEPPEEEPEPEADASEALEGDDTDLQLARAIEVLKSWTYFERFEWLRQAGATAPLQARAPEAETESPSATP
jgi:carboxyl-terminal processing protease